MQPTRNASSARGRRINHPWGRNPRRQRRRRAFAVLCACAAAFEMISCACRITGQPYFEGIEHGRYTPSGLIVGAECKQAEENDCERLD